MAIEFVSSTGNDGAGTTATLDAPTGMELGFLIVATVCTRGNSITSTPDQTGWTSLGIVLGNPSLESFVRFVDGTEPASWTWSLSSNTNWIGGILLFSGTDPNEIINAEAGQYNGTASVNIDGPSITTTYGNTLLIAISVAASGSSVITAPAGYLQRTNASTATAGNAGATMEMATRTFGGPGATGTWFATQTVSRKSTTQHIALKAGQTGGGMLLTGVG